MGKVHLVLVGEDRGIQGGLEAEARDLDIGCQVHFLGQRKDAIEWMAAADVGVLPSREEGFNNALLEMMSVGLPVVATDVGGNRELLEDGRLGLLVPSENAKALAEALSRLLDQKDFRCSLAQRACNEVRKKYSLEQMVNAYISIYKSM